MNSSFHFFFSKISVIVVLFIISSALFLYISLQGKILHLLGEGQLSEKVLRDALSNDPTSSTTWQLLGEALSAMGQGETASQCLSVAAELECSEPLESFHILPRVVH